MTKNSKNKLLGFTLVELLVAVSIVAVLGAIGAVSYGATQKTARTARRAEDLKAIATALEAYKAANGSYPCSNPSSCSANAVRSQCNNVGAGIIAATPNDLIPGLVPTYMPNIPSDPQTDTNGSNCYLYRSNGIDYKILDVYMREFSNADYLKRPELVDPRRDGGPQVTPITTTSCDGANDNTNITAWSIYSLGQRCT